MKLVVCEKCGSNSFKEQDGYKICTFCHSKYIINKDDLPIKSSNISIDSDIDVLLQKCKNDPANARKYANLILDIDSSNEEAQKYL